MSPPLLIACFCILGVIAEQLIKRSHWKGYEAGYLDGFKRRQDDYISEWVDRQAAIINLTRKPLEKNEELMDRIKAHLKSPAHARANKEAILRALDDARPVWMTIEQVIDAIDPRGPRPSREEIVMVETMARIAKNETSV